MEPDTNRRLKLLNWLKQSPESWSAIFAGFQALAAAIAMWAFFFTPQGERLIEQLRSDVVETRRGLGDLQAKRDTLERQNVDLMEQMRSTGNYLTDSKIQLLEYKLRSEQLQRMSEQANLDLSNARENLTNSRKTLKEIEVSLVAAESAKRSVVCNRLQLYHLRTIDDLFWETFPIYQYKKFRSTVSDLEIPTWVRLKDKFKDWTERRYEQDAKLKELFQQADNSIKSKIDLGVHFELMDDKVHPYVAVEKKKLAKDFLPTMTWNFNRPTGAISSMPKTNVFSDLSKIIDSENSEFFTDRHSKWLSNVRKILVDNQQALDVYLPDGIPKDHDFDDEVYTITERYIVMRVALEDFYKSIDSICEV